MKSLRSPRPLAAIGRAPTFLAFLSCSVASAQAPARPAHEPRPAPEAPPAAFAWNPASAERELLIDAPGDGSIWALGASYKTGFDASGATFYPAFGASAPRSYPHRLTPASASVGDVALDFDPAASPTRHGERIEFDRGAFVEVYDLAVDALEQSFVFSALPRRGEIVLRIPVGSEFEAFASAAGIAFRGPLGEVRYGRATAIDAAGREQAAPTAVVDGAIEIRVPADFVESARLPLVIDPVVDGVPINTTTDDAYSPDVAWEPFDLGWLAVYERVFSGTDTDVLARFVNASGATISEEGVDLTGVPWRRPRVANLAAAHQFLAVAEVTSGSARVVKGRTVEANGLILSMGSQFDISDASSGDKVLPDVGGDTTASLPSHYCVVYQQNFSATDTRIVVRMVDPNSTNWGGPIYLTPAGLQDGFPSISNSNNGDEWLLAWVRDSGFPTNDDIMGAYFGRDGTLHDGPFVVAGGSSLFEGAPCASTPLAGSNLSAIAFWRLGPSTAQDVLVALVQGTTVLQTVNLALLENSGTGSRKQIQPSIDSNGSHFLVGYSEFHPVFMQEDVFVSDLFVSGNTLGVSEAHVILQLWGLPQLHSRIAAQHGTPGNSNRFLALYAVTQNSANHDVAGQLFDVADGGTASSFCFGDDSELPCPCGNAGDTGRGCANSQDSNGALLAMTGTPSTLDDSAALEAIGLPVNQPCLFFQGTEAVAMFAFGDGLRCAGGNVIRLAVKNAVGGQAIYPGTGDDPISERGFVPIDGGFRTYQIWYRDPANFCTSSSFNISNGVSVSWAR